MTATVVTFSVQAGSGGQAIARIVSDRLGYAYLDREVISEAAAVVGVSPETLLSAERWPTFVERILERLAKASVLSDGVVPGAAPSAGAAVLTMTSADYRQVIETVVTELGERGHCVILGHAGQVILRDKIEGVYKVLVHGSEEVRARRLADETASEFDAALKQIKELDHQRQEFFKHAYGVDWQDSSLYNLTVNTDELSVEHAADLVLSGIEASE